MLNIVSCVRKLFQIEKKFDVQPELLKGGARTEDIFTLFFYNKIRSRLSYFTLLFLLYMKRPTIIIVTKPCYQYCTFYIFCQNEAPSRGKYMPNFLIMQM